MSENAVALGSNTFYKFENLDKFREGIIEFESIGFFNELIDEIKKSIVFKTNAASLQVIQNEGRAIINANNLLKKLALKIKETLKSIAFEVTDDVLSIKINISTSFYELAVLFHDLEKSITKLIIHDKIKGKINIRNVENGSIWFDIALGSFVALKTISLIICVAFYAYKKYQELEANSLYIKSLGLKTDLIEKISEAAMKSIDNYIETEARTLNKEHFDENDHENLQRIKNSIKTFYKMIDKGIEFYPSLKSNDETLFSLPIFSKKNLLESGTKLLKENIESKIEN